jgi:hypothetical protein
MGTRVDTRQADAALDRISRVLGKEMSDLLNQMGIWFCQSASKASKPGPGSSFGKAPKKYTTRPFVKIEPNRWFLVSYGRGKTDAYVWHPNHPVNLMSGRGKSGHTLMKMATKGVLWWNRKKNDWAIFPWFDNYTNPQRLKVPWASAAKNAFKVMRGLLGGGGGANHFAEAKWLKTKAGQTLFLINRVNYSSQALPNSQAVMDTTARRIEGAYRSKVDKALEKAWYR